MQFKDIKNAVAASVLAHGDTYTTASDAIWEHPEVNFHEDFSAGVIRNLLEKNGFVRCGRIFVANGSSRIAYHKVRK